MQVQSEVFPYARWHNKFSRKKKQSYHPVKRFNHSCVLYRKCLYIFGGANVNQEKPLMDEFVYKLDLATCEWTQLLYSEGGAVPAPISSHCAAVYEDKMYIFGGSNLEQECNNDLWTYNLVQNSWTKVEQKGDIPAARESALMAKIYEHFLLLFGGLNLKTKDTYSDAYVLDCRINQWRALELTGDQMPSLVLQAGCEAHDVMYVFGGQSTLKSIPTYSDLFFSMRCQNGKVEVKQVKCEGAKPPPRCSHALINIQNQFIAAIGGESNLPCEYFEGSSEDENNQVKTRNDAWLFDIVKSMWYRIEPKSPIFRPRSAFVAVQFNKRIYVFGGLRNYSQIHDDLMILELEQDKLNLQQKQLLCETCARTAIPEPKEEVVSTIMEQELPYIYVQSVVNLMKFPFAAFGLLVDNCVNTGATNVVISVIQKNLSRDVGLVQSNSVISQLRGPLDSLRLLMIEDNGRPWSNQEFRQIVTDFQIHSPTQLQINDKKTKALVLKEISRKEFGNNLKLGALRLGKGFLYVSYVQGLARVGLFAPQFAQDPMDTVYKAYFYVQELQTKRFFSPQGAAIKQKIEQVWNSLCKVPLSKFVSSDQTTEVNQLYIFQLRQIFTTDGVFYQINPFKNDYLYNNLSKVLFLESLGYCIYQCPDVSLRAYISLLYLKVDTKIFIQTEGYPQEEITNQMFLDKIDKQKSSNFIKQIEYAHNYPELAECKVVELYYNPNLQRKSNLFYSGILIYHKNRLIARYKYQLGLIFQHKFYKQKYKKSQNNVFQFFGFIQLPESIHSNYMKTGVANPILLEGFESNLKLIIKEIKRKLARKNNQGEMSGIPNASSSHGPGARTENFSNLMAAANLQSRAVASLVEEAINVRVSANNDRNQEAEDSNNQIPNTRLKDEERKNGRPSTIVQMLGSESESESRSDQEDRQSSSEQNSNGPENQELDLEPVEYKRQGQQGEENDEAQIQENNQGQSNNLQDDNNSGEELQSDQQQQSSSAKYRGPAELAQIQKPQPQKLNKFQPNSEIVGNEKQIQPEQQILQPLEPNFEAKQIPRHIQVESEPLPIIANESQPIQGGMVVNASKTAWVKKSNASRRRLSHDNKKAHSFCHSQYDQNDRNSELEGQGNPNP